jgi:hypothetical protein
MRKLCPNAWGFNCLWKHLSKDVINTSACDSPFCQMYELAPQSMLEPDVLMAEVKAYFLSHL